MSLEENKNSKTGESNFYKLAKKEEEGGLGMDREKLMRWWKNREKIKSSTLKNKRRKIVSEKVRRKMRNQLIKRNSFYHLIAQTVI
jgi:hypothetical protein